MEVALFVALMASGQLLFKSTSSHIETSHRAGAGIVAVFQDWRFITAITLYGAGTLLWVQILKKMPLSTVYPLAMGSTIALTSLIGIGIFNETVTLAKIIGIGLLILSLCILGG